MRIPLVQLPTPVHRLDRLSRDLGVDLWIKRDDLTGFALGGNKGRKLEYLIGQAVEASAEVVVTCGSLQSNFIRQLAAACSVNGIHCAAAVMALPYEASVGPPPKPTMDACGGNVALDRILGMDLRRYPDGDWETLFEYADRLEAEYRETGKRVFRIPLGGSSAWGAYAFYEASKELAAQVPEPFDAIVFASSSGSTQTGLAYGFAGTSTRVQGIACDPEPALVDEFATLAIGLEELAQRGVHLGAQDFRFDLRFVGPGYGAPSEAGNAAIRTLARREGIFLDPIYSGKGFAGLLALIEEGNLGHRLLFWHTGGIPALFAYGDDSTGGSSR